MKLITGAITADREFTQTALALKEQLAANKPLPLCVNGLSDGAKDAFLTEMIRFVGEKTPAPTLVLVKDEGEARQTAAFLTGEGVDAVVYPTKDFVFWNISASHDTERERLSVLCRLQKGERITVVTTPYAALEYTVPPAVLAERTVCLAVGDTKEPDALADLLVRMGFARVDTVDGVGQFARRGGIFDVYPAGTPLPVRIEFFDIEIDRMGYFDPVTQRVCENCDELTVIPAKEVPVDQAGREAILAAEEELTKKVGEDLDVLATLSQEKEMLRAGLDVLFADRYISLVYPEKATLFSYFTARTACFVLSDNAMKERADALLAALAEESVSLLEKKLIAPRYAHYAGEYADMENFLSAQVPVYITGFGNSYNGRLAGLFGFRARRTVSYHGKPLLLLEDLKNLLAGSYRVLILTESPTEAEATLALLGENGVHAISLPPDAPADYAVLDHGTVGVTYGAYPAGFDLIVARVAILSLLPDEGVLVRRQHRRRAAAKRSAGEKIMSYADLSVGDYVVHTVHGIGVFKGMQQLTLGGVTRDYITIQYAGNDQLFLPADRLEMIAKYIGAKSEDGTVRINKLGGQEWGRSKARARAAAKDMAKDLVQLYAARQRRPGFAFPEDCELEREFADTFEFEETEPQLVAISEITGDMMRPVPMDRLLCGDVGFGKTEVAFRAAFKAITAGKQVAILVPTTILAMQHYQTALSRMRGYAVNIEMISRLRTPKEQQNIRRRLARGEIDLIIGTHSLLSSQIAFKDLGLLIVDEEQRFGVGQKEKLKELTTNVDVLTLTATPIPRTLNMAMSGIRDMSILDEAPADRHPVQTYVMEHDDFVIEEAVRKELARGGQVLYLYNRVESMERPAAKLQKAFPTARITLANGRMDKETLEDIWQSLVRGEIDILVCTTIIETGVDLPNANTLIIEDADRMGLSQLHQLRGRVGRSGRHAYAYFTFRRGKVLTEIAEKRLKAIREYAEFGAGFKIALRDLEIRGAGNLLGAEQHGHIDAVGYDLYVRILNEAILEEKGIAPEPVFESQIDLNISANIPENYISTSAERMEMYKKISLIGTEEDRADVWDELCDRFGEPPVEVTRLLSVACARAVASRAKIAKVERHDRVLRFVSSVPDLAVWSELFAKHTGLSVTANGAVEYKLDKGADAALTLGELMKEYDALCKKEKNAPGAEGKKDG